MTAMQNSAADRWAAACATARQLTERIAREAAGRPKSYDDEDLEQMGLATEPERAGQIEDELSKALGARGYVCLYDPDGLYVEWDGRYVVARGEDADEILDTDDSEPSAADYHVPGRGPVSVWRSVDYYDETGRSVTPVDEDRDERPATAAIYDAETGDAISEGLQTSLVCDEAWQAARRTAADRGETVHLSDHDGEWLVSPDGSRKRLDPEAA